MEESNIRNLIRKHSVEYHECSNKGIYVNELYVDEFTEELIFELNKERAMEKDSTSGNSLHKHIVSDNEVAFCDFSEDYVCGLCFKEKGWCIKNGIWFK